MEVKAPTSVPAQLPGDAPPRAIFCKGLAKGASERCIAALFSQFGTVLDCQVARHRSGRSAGFAIVTFATHDEATTAIRGMDAVTYMGRPLSCRWYQQERDGAEGLLIQPPKQPNQAANLALTAQHHLHQQQMQQLLQHLQPSGPLPQGMADHPLQHQLSLPPLGGPQQGRSPRSAGLDTWANLHQASGAGAFPTVHSAPAGTEAADGPDGNRRWSAMVNLWLQDYLSQEALGPLPTQSTLSEPSMDAGSLRRSFDGFPPSNTLTERRRSTRDSLSRCLDGLNLDTHLPLNLGTGGADASSQYLAKSRLATKWTTEGSSTSSSGGDSSTSASSGGNAAAAAASLLTGGRASDDFHVLADIKLLSSTLSCPPEATSFLSATNWAAAPAAAAARLKLDGVPSAPATAANSPPGKMQLGASHLRNVNWGAQDDSARYQHADQGYTKDLPLPAPAGAGAGSQAGSVPASLLLSSIGQLQSTTTATPCQAQAQARAQAQAQALHYQAMQAVQPPQSHLMGMGGAGVPQVHQLAYMHQAQEQYVSALNQLTSAHSQVLAAAAALQDAGILPAVPGMQSGFNAGPKAAPAPAGPPTSYPYGPMVHPNRNHIGNNPGYMMLRGHGAMPQALF